MEYRRDYVEAQIQQIGLLLTRLLQRLLKIKSADTEAGLDAIITTQLTLQEGVNVTLQTLSSMETGELISALKEKYNYTTEHFKLLADLFYELPGPVEQERAYKQKALALYQYYSAKNINSADLQVFNRINLLKELF